MGDIFSGAGGSEELRPHHPGVLGCSPCCHRGLLGALSSEPTEGLAHRAYLAVQRAHLLPWGVDRPRGGGGSWGTRSLGNKGRGMGTRSPSSVCESPPTRLSPWRVSTTNILCVSAACWAQLCSILGRPLSRGGEV